MSGVHGREYQASSSLLHNPTDLVLREPNEVNPYTKDIYSDGTERHIFWRNWDGLGRSYILTFPETELLMFMEAGVLLWPDHVILQETTCSAFSSCLLGTLPVFLIFQFLLLQSWKHYIWYVLLYSPCIRICCGTVVLLIQASDTLDVPWRSLYLSLIHGT